MNVFAGLMLRLLGEGIDRQESRYSTDVGIMETLQGWKRWMDLKCVKVVKSIEVVDDR